LKATRFRNLAIVIGLGVLIAPLAFCFWVFYWSDIKTEWSLRLYPGANQVGDSYGYYGAGSGLKIRYFWTPDSMDQVQTYYETFAYPFVNDERNNWRGGLVTVFSLDGSELVYSSVDGVRHNLDFPTNKYCRYTQRYRCANVMLTEISEVGLGALPQLVSPPSWTNVRQPSPITRLAQGTLSIYSYYINDF
jgi:hypothetical protein